MGENIPIIGNIIQFLEQFIPTQNYIDWVYNFVSDLSFLEQAIGIAVLNIVLVIGVFGLAKKLSKLLIVAAIVFGIWLLYTNGIFG